MSNLKAAFIAAQTALTALESGAHILNTVLAMNEATKAVSYPRIIWRASTTRRAIAVKAVADRMAEMIGEAHAEALELDIALEGTATINIADLPSMDHGRAEWLKNRWGMFWSVYTSDAQRSLMVDDAHDAALIINAYKDRETLADYREMFYHGHGVSRTVNTHELKEGDIIRHYHMLIRLGKRTDWGVTDGHTEAYNGSCISFAGEVVYVHGCPNDANPMPQGYQVQGNKLAHWAVVA